MEKNVNLYHCKRKTYLKSLQSLSMPFSRPLPLALVGSLSSPTFISGLLSSSKGDTFSCASLFSLPSWSASPAPCVNTKDRKTFRQRNAISTFGEIDEMQEFGLHSLHSCSGHPSCHQGTNSGHTPPCSRRDLRLLSEVKAQNWHHHCHGNPGLAVAAPWLAETLNDLNEKS